MHSIMRDVLLSLRKEGHEMALEQMRFQRETGERQMLGRAMPSLINYLTNREVMPESHADSQLVESMALKFQPQDLQMLVAMGKMSQEEALVLAARFTKIREEHEKRQKALQTIPVEEPVAGDNSYGK